jgi:hypothetical protein
LFCSIDFCDGLVSVNMIQKKRRGVNDELDMCPNRWIAEGILDMRRQSALNRFNRNEQGDGRCHKRYVKKQIIAYTYT